MYMKLSCERVEQKIKPVVVTEHGGEESWLPNLIADLKHWARENGLDWEQEEYQADRYVAADLDADAVAEEAEAEEERHQYCKTCKRHTFWRIRKALVNTLVGHADFPGDEVQYGKDIERGRTVSRTGPPVLVTVESCSECGRSITM